MKKTYEAPAVSYKKRPGRVSKTIPNQTMSLDEIVKRYTRGVPVAMDHKDPVYVPDGEHDLEKVSRMDFGDRAAFADQLREQNERVEEAFRAKEEAMTMERNERLASEKKAREEGRSIDDLDNTMLRDSNAETQPVASKSKKP